VSNRSSAGTLIGDTANQNQQSTQIKSSQMLVFEERGNWSTRRKPLGAEQRTNKLNPHMTPDLEIEPGPYWWEASALITAPSLHSQDKTFDKMFFTNVWEMFLILGVLPIGSIAIFLLLSEKTHMPSKFNSSLNYFRFLSRLIVLINYGNFIW